MAKFMVEEDTANKSALVTCGGNHIWKIGSNYVVVYWELYKVKYRYSADFITWDEEILVDETVSEDLLNETTAWYQSISGSDILYVVWRQDETTINIGKWDVSTIETPAQIGVTYDLSTGIGWSPTWHHKLAVASDNKLWLTGMTWDSGGGDYHEYYTVKATNVMDNSTDNDIDAWGTPLNIGTVDGGTDKEFGGVCILAGSRASSKMLFLYTNWTGSTTMTLKYRWGDGNNADVNWDPIPPIVGTNYDTIYSTDLATYGMWRKGTTLQYAPSGMPGMVWVVFPSMSGITIIRFDIENETLAYTKLVSSTRSHYIGLSVVSYGGFDVVHTVTDVDYEHKVMDEQSGTISTLTILDAVLTINHSFVAMPLSMVDQDDVMVIYTE